MKLSNSEHEQTERAMRKPGRGNRAMEERLSVSMGMEEAAQVARALVAASPTVGMMRERARCLAICREFPDNLMACWIADRIRNGGA